MPLPPTVQIDRLNLSLPPAWKGQASLFARQLAHLLGELEVAGDVRLERLAIPPIEARPGETYQVVARRVARRVQSQLATAADPSPAPAPSAAPVIPFPSPSPSRHA